MIIKKINMEKINHFSEISVFHPSTNKVNTLESAPIIPISQANQLTDSIFFIIIKSFPTSFAYNCRDRVSIFFESKF